MLDDSMRINLSFAGGGPKAAGCGMVGAPHMLGLPADDGAIWFGLVDIEHSPTLLGLDWLEAA
eukprot:3662480-Alexandrium_andersonii.AAC.1